LYVVNNNVIMQTPKATNSPDKVSTSLFKEITTSLLIDELKNMYEIIHINTGVKTNSTTSLEFIAL
ncbi:hypothetical protein D1N78_06515, partial [Clostridioides difficile]